MCSALTTRIYNYRAQSSASGAVSQDANFRDRMHLLLSRSPGWWVVFLPGAFWLLSSSAFGATLHDDAHGAFMTLPPYTRTREGEVRQLGSGPKPCRLGFCVRKCSPEEL